MAVLLHMTPADVRAMPAADFLMLLEYVREREDANKSETDF